jgi:hypothetical protein
MPLLLIPPKMNAAAPGAHAQNNPIGVNTKARNYER